jgi:hypothetical protein
MWEPVPNRLDPVEPVMRVMAAYLLILLTVAGVIVAWWLSRRNERRGQSSIRYVIERPDEEADTSDISPKT